MAAQKQSKKAESRKHHSRRRTLQRAGLGLLAAIAVTLLFLYIKDTQEINSERKQFEKAAQITQVVNDDFQKVSPPKTDWEFTKACRYSKGAYGLTRDKRICSSSTSTSLPPGAEAADTDKLIAAYQQSLTLNQSIRQSGSSKKYNTFEQSSGFAEYLAVYDIVGSNPAVQQCNLRFWEWRDGKLDIEFSCGGVAKAEYFPCSEPAEYRKFCDNP
jgi:hypothetical protein